tara:strand:- start:1641 stop:2702 length:1062 start_codon:yes stop_codon:yes gene_type:complete
MPKRRALITGITGQDGSYLAELLLEKGYEVHGMKRRSSSFNTSRIDHIHNDDKGSLILHYGDMTDSSSIIRIIEQSQPEEIYNLAAQSHVQISFETPEYTANCDAIGTLRILEAMRFLGLDKTSRFYQASTSELYGATKVIPQTELTPFEPCSPYAIAKLYAFWITKNYREAYSMFACNGILFNHESSRRSGNFLTRKVTRGFSRIDVGIQDCLSLGNLNALRDWGYAKEYAYMMWKMLQLKKPEDFVIATGRQETVRRFCELTAKELGWNGIDWSGEGLNEVGRRRDTGAIVVKIDSNYFRPAEVPSLLGDSQKAQDKLGWKPGTSLESLIKEMCTKDHEIARKEAHLAKTF